MNTLSHTAHLYLYLALLRSSFKICWNNFALSLLDTGADGDSDTDGDSDDAAGCDVADAVIDAAADGNDPIGA